MPRCVLEYRTRRRATSSMSLPPPDPQLLPVITLLLLSRVTAIWLRVVITF